MTVPEILSIHPPPWGHILQAQSGQPGGVVRVIDANGQEVALFTMLDYVVQMTALQAQQATSTVAKP